MKDPRRTAQGNHDPRDTSGEGGGGGPEAVRVKLLGGFSVSVGSRIIEEGEWRLRKAAGLIKLLALAPGHRMHREQIMDLLWPDLDFKAASNNLRYILHVTRRALETTPSSKASHYLHLRGEQVLLCPSSPLWVDVDAFEEASATARRLRKPPAYRAAIELYAGELLPEDLYEGWAEERRAELKRTYLALLVELAGVYEERKEFGPAIEALGRAVAAEPTHEEAHEELMRLYALSGQRERALEQYELLREALSRELGRQPKATSQHLREEIAAGRFPTARSSSEGSSPEEPPEGRRHNLPAPRTSFVGRERERVEVKRMLTMTRLLTLTGIGGSGKTRLALEVARDLVEVYSRGVWLVELAGLSEGDLVPQAVAEALKVRERPGRSLTETLVEALRTKEMLLVLDNCEHVIDAAARLADALLDGCPRLRILATSREALEVAGEVNWRVPSLSVPEHGQPPTVESVTHFESARLFVERARYRRSAFMVTPQDILAVVEICQQLDGIPLAMELSAALVGMLSVKQIATRLGDSLELLTAGGRTAAPRHRTLRGTLQWSFELLGEQERKLFGRLSVFVGGWTLEAAEAVGAGEGIDTEEVVDLLGRLVGKSLVVTEADEGGGLRYRMLEPVRQYAQEKLEESGQADATRRRHAAFFLELAEEAKPGLMGAQQEASWMERIEVEHDNFRAALSWTLERGEAELGLRLGGALGGFWQIRGYLIEG